MSYLTYVIVGRPTILPPTFSLYTSILPVIFFIICTQSTPYSPNLHHSSIPFSIGLLFFNTLYLLLTVIPTILTQLLYFHMQTCQLSLIFRESHGFWPYLLAEFVRFQSHNVDRSAYARPPPPATTFRHFTMYSIALALIFDRRLAYFSSAHPILFYLAYHT